MNILLADDDADDRNLFQHAFKKAFKNPSDHNFSLHWVKDGAELLNYLNKKVANKEELPDLIFLDLNMPRINGREALKEIKSSSQLRHIQVIILSTSSSEADKVFACSNGAKTYIEKPFEFDRWIEIIRTSCLEAEQDCLHIMAGKTGDTGHR